MRNLIGVTLLSIIILNLYPPTADGCSSYFLSSGGRPYFGRNFDYDVKGGLVFVNKRNLAKSAASFEKPAGWISIYGSVTFNLYGRELPMGGMNEAGLVVAVLWLEDTVYPARDSLPTVNDLQWVQYQLDNCATIDDVLATRSRIRVSNYGGSKIHYLLSDAAGNSAAVEFLRARGHEKIICMGASLGGAVCLWAAANLEIDGIVVIASPMSMGAPTEITDDDFPGLTMPKLYIVSENDNGDTTDSMRYIADHSPDPKEFMVYPGISSHGTDMFASAVGDQFEQDMLDFLLTFVSE